MAWDLTQYNSNVTAGLIPAGSHLFADDAAFQTLDSAGNVIANAAGNVYTIPDVPDYATPIPYGDPRLSPLTVYVDVDKPSPGQSTQIKTDGNGYLVPFATPSGHAKVWVDFGAGRVMLTASDLGDQIDSVAQTGTYQLLSQKNQANGYAGLDSTSKLSSAAIPDLSGTYQSKTAPNPWRYNLTVNDFGLILKGVAGSTSQIFQVQDPNGSPIFSVGHVGGAAVYGDHLKVFPPGDVFNPKFDVDPATGSVTIAGSTLSGTDIFVIHNVNGALDADGTNLNVHGNFNGSAKPGNHNLIAWTFDPSTLQTGKPVVAGTVYLSAVYVAKTANITRIYWGVGSPVAGAATAGQNFVGLYDSTGALKVSANVDSAVTTTNGLVSTLVTSTQVTPGTYWVAWVFNNTAPTPALLRGSDIHPWAGNIGVTGTPASLRYATNGTAKTTLPATITPSANTISQPTYWAAIGP